MHLLSDATITDPTSPPASTATACSRAVLDGMPPVMWFIRRHMRSHRTAGLSVPQFRALVLLDCSPTASLSAVAEHLGSSQPTASRLIDGLVSRQFVHRKSCEADRRQVELILTPKGRSVLTKARQGTQAALAEKLASLSPHSRRKILQAMNVLDSAFSSDR